MLQEYQAGKTTIAGCDEAGRGCLAGPVFAAAVILPKGCTHPLLNDSKKIKESDRLLLRSWVETHAISWAVASCDHEEIDQLNILQASFEAMHRSVLQLNRAPGLLLIDGNRFRPFPGIPHRCVVGGDGLYTCIAAASILAKTHRDAYMDRLHAEFPQYGWDRNRAYATAQHRQAIALFGMSPYHRKSFHLKNQLALEL